MRVQYLGTGAYEGIPALFCECAVCRAAREKGGRSIRTRSSALVDDALKLDFPPDTFLHALKYPNLCLPRLQYLLITHTHADHFAAFDLIGRLPAFSTPPADAPVLTVYGSAAMCARLAAALEAERRAIGGRIRLNPLTAFQTVSIGEHRVTPLKAAHMRSETCFVYLIERAGEKLLYANDTSFFPEETLEFLKGRSIDLVSLDCTAALRESQRHMNLSLCRELRRRLLESGAAKPGAPFVLQHISHNGGAEHDALQGSAPDFIVAWDGLTLEIE